MVFKFLSRYINVDLGIDLGTANTLIVTEKDGIIINEPSVISYYRPTQKIEIGQAAKAVLGKHNADTETIRPLKDGVIADFVAAEDLIQQFIKRANIPRLFLNHIVCGVPTGITPVEKRAVSDTIERAGARMVSLIAEPMAAAIGVGLDVQKPKASMIIDIGGGTTDIAVIAYGGLVVDNTIKVAGDELTLAIIHYFKNQYSLMIGEQTAEELKIRHATAVLEDEPVLIKLKGLDTVLGQPKLIEINSNDLYYAIENIVELIIVSVRQTIERTPPDLVSDLIDFGVVLTGGGSLIHGLDQRISDAIHVPVHTSDDALYSVVNGTKRVLENYADFKNVLL